MVQKYKSFREKYKTFIYNGYTVTEDDNKIDIVYDFEVPGLSKFAPTWSFPKKNGKDSYVNDTVFDKLAFSLGMVELVSYWKIACPPKVIVKCGILDEEMIDWWKSLYFNGLGEFYYTNGIMDENEKDFMDIVVEYEDRS